MRTAILVLWWIGLVGALIPTLVILKQASLIVGALRDILRLAELTRTAARGIAVNVQAVERLSGVDPLVGRLVASTDALAEPLESLAQRLDRVTGG